MRYLTFSVCMSL